MHKGSKVGEWEAKVTQRPQMPKKKRKKMQTGEEREGGSENGAMGETDQLGRGRFVREGRFLPCDRVSAGA